MSDQPEKYLKRAEDFSYDIKRIGADDFSVLIPLMENCFGMDVNVDYFRWKYTENPAGSFVGFIAVDKFTKVVGAYYGVIPQVFEVDGKEYTIFQSCDTMTHSSHRRRGLFKKLATHCYNELRKEGKLFVIGFGGGQSTPGFLQFGWDHIFDFRYYFKPALLCRFGKISKDDYPKVEVLKALDAIENGLDVSRSQLSGRAKGIRTVEQIKWRLSNPSHQYLIIKLKNDSESFVTFYVQGDKLMVFDLHFKNAENGKLLLAFLNSQVTKKGFRGIFSFCQENGPDATALKQNGFINNPFSFGPMSERVPFIFYAPKKDMERFNSPSDWQITTYDHDSL
ncbi:MAG: GNAT family N-acetyltransferase [Flavobacteriales bacterium]|nr:GNAT family N-acetyltransferase [Flavobacteriales bacterium]